MIPRVPSDILFDQDQSRNCALQMPSSKACPSATAREFLIEQDNIAAIEGPLLF
jgi:hypothetical protein